MENPFPALNSTHVFSGFSKSNRWTLELIIRACKTKSSILKMDNIELENVFEEVEVIQDPGDDLMRDMDLQSTSDSGNVEGTSNQLSTMLQILVSMTPSGLEFIADEFYILSNSHNFQFC